jgi:hypothetical protein
MTIGITGRLAFAGFIWVAAGLGHAETDLAGWLKSTPQASSSPGGATAAQPYKCPSSQTPSNPQSPNRPAFAFNFPDGELLSCLQDGPYKWTSGGGGDWYVQRIERKACAGIGKSDCTVTRFTRVCSQAGIAPNSIPTPCEKPTGPRGCAVCGP